MKTPHPHAEILKAYADDTSVEIECHNPDRLWDKVDIDSVIDYPGFEFRIKPKMLSINGIEFPEPMRVAPEIGTPYCVVDSSRVRGYIWDGSSLSAGAELKSGFCHLTEEAAQQHRRAIVLANGGEL